MLLRHIVESALSLALFNLRLALRRRYSSLLLALVDKLVGFLRTVLAGPEFKLALVNWSSSHRKRLAVVTEAGLILISSGTQRINAFEFLLSL